MKEKNVLINSQTFEDIKCIDEYGNEFWEARKLQHVLEYAKWEKFLNVINKAKQACVKSGYDLNDHFPQVGKMVKTGVSTKNLKDYHLSRYACYLIVQNGDPKKEVIALAQTYFAIQTRKQELTEVEYNLLNEDEKRLYHRKQTKDGNYSLNQVAKQAGVKNFDIFHNQGYKGLYDGETADDIAKRKKLRYREEILDNMGSAELIANAFRISQTEQKMVNEKIIGDTEAGEAHYKVGKIVRNAIKEMGGTPPEKLPTPNKSIKQLEKETIKNKKNQLHEKIVQLKD